jgi:phosphoribosylformylglycinamidine cyclo-ligase (EC 6.3.3.1)
MLGNAVLERSLVDYRSAGVDVEAGQKFVQQIKGLVQSTYRSEVLGGLGGFSGLFALPSGYQQPVLVAGTDGVGTKLKIAQACNKHDTIGIDLVAMCVNDVLTCGAEPLFFLDYLAVGKLHPEQLVQVVQGIAIACQEAGCALIGGETAEMPGFYQGDEYDVAGFCVGIVEKSQILDGSRVQIGDAVVGIASSGLHSNGFSLVRKIIAERGYAWSDRYPPDPDYTIGEICLTPTRIYVRPILHLLKTETDSLGIHSLAHITGGGLPENLPRCLSQGQSIRLYASSWEIPPIFQWLAQAGDVSLPNMYQAFNMGIGMVAVVDPSQAEIVRQQLHQHHLTSWIIGEVVAGAGTVIF